ncbi:MAG: hypothetical protein IKT61_04965 [Clostridia bacterium]|nr:hypothetical protein [Clostridia bacterium]
MHTFEDMIEKYRRELLDFSKQNPVHTVPTEAPYREVSAVIAQPEVQPEMQPETQVVAPQTVITARVPFRNYDDFINGNPSRGVLRVQVFSADRTFPVSNASVRVFVNLADGEREIFNGVTDMDGVVDNISLPAPDSSLSFDENNTVEPFAVYGLRVNKADYSPAVFDGIPVFDSVKSIQPVELVPLSRSGGEPVQTVVPSEPMTLFGGDT